MRQRITASQDFTKTKINELTVQVTGYADLHFDRLDKLFPRVAQKIELGELTSENEVKRAIESERSNIEKLVKLQLYDSYKGKPGLLVKNIYAIGVILYSLDSGLITCNYELEFKPWHSFLT